jgi:type IV pilus assembly protein PilM
MNINIISHGTSILARDVVLGSRQLTEQIENLFGVSFAEAEGLKTGEIVSGDKQEELENLFANTCTQWVTEVKRAIDFYYSNHPGQTISKIVLSGGGAKIQGLTDFFAKETDIAVEIFNPFQQTAVDNRTIDPAYLKSIAPEMTLAAGLATRPVEV